MIDVSPGAAERGSRHSDLRLVAPAALAWLVACAVLTQGARRGAWVVLGAVGVLVCAALVGRGGRVMSLRSWTSTLAALAVVVGAVGGIAVMRIGAVRPSVVRMLVARHVSGEASLVVTGDPVPIATSFAGSDGQRVRVPARLDEVRTVGALARVRVPVTVFAPSSWGTLLPGTHVRAVATFAPAAYRDEAALVQVRGPPEIWRRADRVERAAGVLRADLRASVATLAADPRGLVPGMVLGDTSGVPPQLTADERVAGLTHLTAVSGENVAILLGAVLVAARAVGLRRRLRVGAGLVAVIGFVVLARPQPSVLRAAVMGCVVLLGVLRGSPGGGPRVLAAGVLALVAVDPWLALSVGFALSVAATAALLFFAPAWRRRLRGRLPPSVAEPLAIACVAHLGTVPLIVGLSGHVSLVAVAANVLADPAVVPVTVLGALATVLAPLSPVAARWCVRPAGWAAWWIAAVARRSAQLPLAQIGWPSGRPALLVLIVIALAGLAAGPSLVGIAARTVTRTAARAAASVGPSWHASRDVSRRDLARPGDPRGRSGGSARGARGRRGRHRCPRRRRERGRA